MVKIFKHILNAWQILILSLFFQVINFNPFDRRLVSQKAFVTLKASSRKLGNDSCRQEGFIHFEFFFYLKC